MHADYAVTAATATPRHHTLILRCYRPHSNEYEFTISEWADKSIRRAAIQDIVARSYELICERRRHAYGFRASYVALYSAFSRYAMMLLLCAPRYAAKALRPSPTVRHEYQ